MSTHCNIAVKTEEGYETIYVHYDGYESHMYPMLTNNYNSEESAKALVDLGDASSIEKHLEPLPGSTHTFDSPEKDVSVFYHRDRGEPWNNCKPTYLTKTEVINNSNYYAYIWEDGKWSAYKNGRKITVKGNQ